MSARDFARRHIFNNLTLKLTSLLLAVGLWLAVSSSPPSEVALSVAIIFRNMPPELEISSKDIPQVQIRVRGPERIVRRIQPSDLQAEIDLTGMKPGEHTFDLTRAISVPQALKVAQVVPSEVHVEFDSRATRDVVVHPRIIGNFASGYKIASIHSDPESVTITGPKKELDSVDSAITDPIDISGVLDRIAVARPAYVSDPLIQVTSPQNVRITVTMEKETNPSR